MQGGNNSIEAENTKLDAAYWSNRYKEGTAAWDLGEVSPPIKQYIDQLTDKEISILIPGCGNTYEADYLLKKGFTNITVIDIAPALVTQLTEKYKSRSNIKIILGDFFEHRGAYDLVLEQTFFCALEPALREKYVTKMHELISPGGKLVGVLFNRDFEQDGPPFGGNETIYRPLFSPHFSFKTFAPCYNSFIKRKDTELFVILVNKTS